MHPANDTRKNQTGNLRRTFWGSRQWVWTPLWKYYPWRLLALELSCFVFTSAHLHQVSSQRAVSQYHRLPTGVPLFLLSINSAPSHVNTPRPPYPGPHYALRLCVRGSSRAPSACRGTARRARLSWVAPRWAHPASGPGRRVGFTDSLLLQEIVPGGNLAVVSRSAGGNKKTIFAFHTYVATKGLLLCFVF